MRFGITNELACALGVIARDNPACALHVEWREGDPERIWRVIATDGSTEKFYVVDDETGISGPATEWEINQMLSDYQVSPAMLER